MKKLYVLQKEHEEYVEKYNNENKISSLNTQERTLYFIILNTYNIFRLADNDGSKYYTKRLFLEQAIKRMK